MRLPGRKPGPGKGDAEGLEKGSERDRAAAAAAREKAAARAEARKQTEARARAAKSRPKAAGRGTAEPSRGASATGKPAPSAGSEPGRSARAEPRKALAAAGGAGAELLKLGREMLEIPAQLWMAAAEVAGVAVLTVWTRAVRPLLSSLRAIVTAAVRYAERRVRPAHGVIAACLVALGALAASQWLDYRTISVGGDAYSGSVGIVAPAPEVDTRIAGPAHGWVMLPLAAAGLLVLAFALAGRRRLARLLIPLGIVVLAISLIVDAPKGLDEGQAALAYQGAKASLLGGFWLQIATAVVLVACGFLLPRYLGRERAPATAPRTPPRHGGPRSLIARARRRAGRLAAKRGVQGAGT